MKTLALAVLLLTVTTALAAEPANPLMVPLAGQPVFDPPMPHIPGPSPKPVAPRPVPRSTPGPIPTGWGLIWSFIAALS